MLYGHDRTIHRTKCVNVELDKDGKVVSVWYRCMCLPFNQTVVDDERAADMRRCYENPMFPIEAIEFGEPGTEHDDDPPAFVKLMNDFTLTEEEVAQIREHTPDNPYLETCPRHNLPYLMCPCPDEIVNTEIQPAVNVPNEKGIIAPVTCSRCGKTLPDSIFDPNDEGLSCGFYCVAEFDYGPNRIPAWSAFARPGEKFLCDACMWSDPKFIALYGVHKP